MVGVMGRKWTVKMVGKGVVVAAAAVVVVVVVVTIKF